MLSDTSYAWEGRVYSGTSKEGEIGTVSLIHHAGGVVTGSITLGMDRYLITPLAHGYVALSEMDLKRFDAEGAAPVVPKEAGVTVPPDPQQMHEAPQPAPRPAPQERSMNASTTECTPHKQKVLVVYDYEVPLTYPNMGAVVSQLIQDANAAYWNSDSYYYAHLVAVHHQAIDLPHNDNYTTMLTTLRGNSTVNQLRLQYKADLVVYLSENLWSNGSVTGAAYQYAGSSYGYSVSNISNSLIGYTFAHEIGHNQGAHHHPDDPNTYNANFSYGYGHRFNGYSTVMAYRPSGETRIRHFSNPSVSYQGSPTGTSARDNARVLRTTRKVIADYMVPDELGLSLYHTDSWPQQYNPLDVTFTGYPCGGLGPYSYSWAYSTTGGNYAQWNATGPSTVVSLFPDDQIFMRLTVTSLYDGQTVTLYDYAENPYGCAPGDPNCSCDPNDPFCENLMPAPEPSTPEAFQVSVAPNPASNITTLKFDVPNAAHVIATLHDVQGREVMRLTDQSYASGTYEVPTDVSALPPGVYLVRVAHDGMVHSAILVTAR